MKTYFNGYGYRETKSWSCTDCNAFHTSGMDLSVDESIKIHKEVCTSKPKGILRILQEASERVELKDLVFLIYAEPDKVKKAIEALKSIAGQN